MSCEETRQQLSLIMDAEGEGMEQAGLFAHLEGCPGCRQFLDSLIRFRKTAQRDREEILREAEERLPSAAPLPGAIGRGAAARARRAAFVRPLVPAPGFALGVLLLVAGIAIGAGLASHRQVAKVAPQVETGTSTPNEPQVVYVCSMPEVKVTAKALPPDR